VNSANRSAASGAIVNRSPSMSLMHRMPNPWGRDLQRIQQLTRSLTI
jgi:hypothetical protein